MLRCCSVLECESDSIPSCLPRNIKDVLSCFSDSPPSSPTFPEGGNPVLYGEDDNKVRRMNVSVRHTLLHIQGRPSPRKTFLYSSSLCDITQHRILERVEKSCLLILFTGLCGRPRLGNVKEMNHTHRDVHIQYS